MRTLTRLADYNLAGPVNALIKPIQEMDAVNDWGQRQIFITKGHSLLAGFSLNRKNPFDSIVRSPLQFELSKQDHRARITIPRLIPGINFFMPPGHYPLFTFTIEWGMVPDIIFRENKYELSAPLDGRASLSTPYGILL